MKSLRVHFFNRHGIDLDNPGSNASSSLLLALEQSNLPHLMQQGMAVAAAAAAFQNSNDTSSVDTSRSQDNITPPMHYLTPHVEISMADNNEPVRIGSPNSNSAMSSGLDIQAIVRPKSNPTSSGSEAGIAAVSSGAGGSTLSKTGMGATVATSGSGGSSRQIFDSTITPSISLIPIKQEPNMNDDHMMVTDQKGGGGGGSASSSSMERASPAAVGHDQGSIDGNSPSTSNLTSLIKVQPRMTLIKAQLMISFYFQVSPLKSLLREDLKRRISARAIRTRSSTTTLPSALSISMSSSGALNATTGQMSPGSSSCHANNMSNSPNGMITSTGETELIITGRKLNLKCLFCNIEFPDQTLYFLHKGCHSESNAWKCNICGEQLNNVYEFNSHLLSKSHQ